jgi:hypothetical protein
VGARERSLQTEGPSVDHLEHAPVLGSERPDDGPRTRGLELGSEVLHLSDEIRPEVHVELPHLLHHYDAGILGWLLVSAGLVLVAVFTEAKDEEA